MTDSTYATYLVAGCVTLVCNKLSASERQDGLDAFLYAQVVASNKHPDFADDAQWSHANRMAIRTLGGVLLSEPSISFPAPMLSTFTLGELLAPLLGQSSLRPATESLMSSLKTLSGYPADAPEQRLFRQHSVQGEARVRLQVGIIEPGIQLGSLGVSFALNSTVDGNPLCQRFDSANVIGNVSINAHRALVETEDYDLSRSTITGLLGSLRQEQVIEFRGTGGRCALSAPGARGGKAQDTFYPGSETDLIG
ncbi:hypothetical protein [Pseudomonas sp. 6D_7.1_Bac1]|uniref:hypothetical protein n=1 Tax=Pseudomonas sp. 6D_7.1_Bac1 TaxID=2971615 RepID=UPI0021CAC7FA|nr:hypothetical protein [Pseudomonas sp. 6D_7.1_Bac1]MCU1751486.1 hypothetical protein [Pseudomonas sp. 6D_7.1_Bac1]